MSVSFKKVVFVSLIFVGVGFGVASIFFPPLAALAGGAILGAIAIAKNIKTNQPSQNHPKQEKKPDEKIDLSQVVPVSPPLPGQHLTFSYEHHKRHYKDHDTDTERYEVTIDDASPDSQYPKLRPIGKI